MKRTGYVSYAMLLSPWQKSVALHAW